MEIVVGVDGSAGSKAALRWAVEEARFRGAQVVAVYAYDVPQPALGITPAPRPDLIAPVIDRHELALQFVTGVVDEVLGDDSPVTVTSAATEGPAAPVLIEAALHAALLVVGSRGHGGFAGLLLGSVSQQCAQHAGCPVVIHRARSSAD